MKKFNALSLARHVFAGRHAVVSGRESNPEMCRREGRFHVAPEVVIGFLFEIMGMLNYTPPNRNGRTDRGCPL
jgi:hypothetical protein